ncbi:Asp23/Gls24 family envelope stress response protein [Streptomyces alanosinicus]|uniref:Asp23/Gls24 family envelope stress response protein n=1 Tax=Streptomyces alanosinicus TaxID=68171 RepID=A0A918YNW2_9ACTN|nr:Asp23/Gls24 family envelope stress response protein [Streptomyces alanosinicus]GHE10117.1 hypothetical protein GCM10010339_65130 [Streptomyces alanosinicus]
MTVETGAVRPPSALVPPGERGATRIADRVVAKIAAQAAREALPPLPADAALPHTTVVVSRPRASGTAAPDTARVSVHLELGYPCDIGTHCAAVRRHVAERVSALVDMTVTEVAVHVERLHPAPHGRA